MTRERDAGRLVDAVVPGLYAWTLTVGWPLSHRFAPLAARIFALVGLVALGASALLRTTAPSAARALGIWAFLGACFAAWATSSLLVSPEHLDPLQGILGALGWAFFAASWSENTYRPPTEEAPKSEELGAGPHRAGLSPRRATPATKGVIFALVAAASSVPMALAWLVQTTQRALLAHVVALAGAISLVTVAADIAGAPIHRRDRPGRPPRAAQRLRDAAPALVGLAALTVVGAAYRWLR